MKSNKQRSRLQKIHFFNDNKYELPFLPSRLLPAGFTFQVPRPLKHLTCSFRAEWTIQTASFCCDVCRKSCAEWDFPEWFSKPQCVLITGWMPLQCCYNCSSSRRLSINWEMLNIPAEYAWASIKRKSERHYVGKSKSTKIELYKKRKGEKEGREQKKPRSICTIPKRN